MRRNLSRRPSSPLLLALALMMSPLVLLLPSPSYAEPSVLPGVPAVPPAEAEFSVTAGAEGARITVAAADRVGLLADVAAALAIARIPVRGARAWDQDGVAVSTWLVAEPAVDARLIRQRYAAVHEGRVDAEARLGRVAEGLDAVVLLHPEASDRSTVLEVRAADRPGVLATAISIGIVT